MNHYMRGDKNSWLTTMTVVGRSKFHVQVDVAHGYLADKGGSVYMSSLSDAISGWDLIGARNSPNS